MPVQTEQQRKMASSVFLRRFRWLIFQTWNIPPVVGLGFIVLINVLTPAQLFGILTTPIEPAYIIGWLLFSVWFLPYKIRSFTAWLDGDPSITTDAAIRAIRHFPFWYWATFLTYLVVAPASVILAAEVYTDYVATPVDWFRIELVALIVSIIVGLPIFFLTMDLFGKALGGAGLVRPIVTVTIKVFLIGALIPLLIDTMLVQYYWTRTGFFTAETFAVWILLELLAIGGSLIFMRSFSQSLAPLQNLDVAGSGSIAAQRQELTAASTDEIGVLTMRYRALLADIRLYNEVLQVSNTLLRDVSFERGQDELCNVILQLAKQTINADKVFLIVYDESRNELVGVAQTGAAYKTDGHYRLKLDAISMAVQAFNQAATLVISDVQHDPNCNPELRARFEIKSAVTVPLLVEQKKFGVLMAVHVTNIHHYQKREIALLEGLAREAAFALYGQQLRQARIEAEDALRESEQRLKRQQEALVRLADQQVYAARDMTRVLQAVTEIVAQVLGVQRASLWQLDNEHNTLNCLDLYNGVDKSHRQSESLRGEAYPNYFAALRANRTVVANAAHQSLETREFCQTYQSPPEITAMLDAPIQRAGKAIGVLCCEYVGGQRQWTTDEANFASSVADFVSLCLELHEHHQTAAELALHRERLEELVSIRTMQLEATNRELEAFSYSVSHDLRAPLRAIDGFSQALLEDYSNVLDKQGQHFLVRVRAASQRMAALIDDLLKLSRLSRTPLKSEAVNLSALVHEIIVNLQEGEPVRHIQWDIAENIYVHADKGLMRIVLENLLENAWKYTKNKSGTRIAFQTKTLDGETVYYVRDNGVGFDMQFANKLFGAFQRLHGREYQGSGIGLATVQRIIHRHGGRIWAEAEINKGATFYFTIRDTLPTE